MKPIVCVICQGDKFEAFDSYSSLANHLIQTHTLLAKDLIVAYLIAMESAAG